MMIGVRRSKSISNEKVAKLLLHDIALYPQRMIVLMTELSQPSAALLMAVPGDVTFMINPIIPDIVGRITRYFFF